MLVRFYCLLFILALFLPTLQHSLNILPSTTLIGKEQAPPKAQWTVAGWLDSTFQHQYTKRRNSRLGLRDYLVKTYNQLHYSIFNRITSTTGTDVVFGKDKWLYEKIYIEKFNTASNDDGSFIEEQVQSLRKLQDQLKGLKIAFVYIIAPSKAELYPEYIPDLFLKDKLPLGVETDYQQTRASLDKNEVNFVDCHTLFLEEKRDRGYQLFGPSGVHWNMYGAYLAWKNLAPLVNASLKIPLHIPPLVRVESRTSRSHEADLGEILNLWEDSLTSPATDYPVFASLPQGDSEKPSILIVGDSFLFTLVDVLKSADLAIDVDAWYYFKRHFKYRIKEESIKGRPVADEAPLDRRNIDWQKQLFEKDLVILVATEARLPELGFGFIEEASAAIERFAVEQGQL